MRGPEPWTVPAVYLVFRRHDTFRGLRPYLGGTGLQPRAIAAATPIPIYRAVKPTAGWYSETNDTCKAQSRYANPVPCPLFCEGRSVPVPAASDGSRPGSLAARADEASERRAAVQVQFARAEGPAQRSKPERERSLQEYTQAAAAYRRVYLITPHAALRRQSEQVADLFPDGSAV